MASSWFQKDALKGLTEKVQSSVQKAMPSKEMLEKLTLTTPELTAERQRIDQEERHKEAVRDMLAGMMPWETRDPERDILVEECKEAILKLSSDTDVFYGPYPMPKVSVKLEESNEATKSDDEDDETEVAETEEKDEDTSKQRMPSAESQEKLKTLEPLPPLLQDFDLDSHVGLIQKLLAADPNLVEMQSSLSGGGDHEKVFWRNYFFHCAWCRYEAGLSIDEIWSDEQTTAPVVAGTMKDTTTADSSEKEKTEEETITFEGNDDKEAPQEKAFPSEPTTDADAPFSKERGEDKDATATAAATNLDSTDFEMVGAEAPDADAANGDDENVDYELDELEAEIARELEDTS